MAKYKAGQSGNPAGRPPGRPDKRHALRKLLEPHAPILVEKAIALALDGDAVALRMCLDRLIPPLRAASLPVALELGGGTLSERGEAIMTQVNAGEVSPEQAHSLLGALASLAAIRAADEIERRVRALEDRHAQPAQTS